MTKYTNVFETLELSNKYNKNGRLIPNLIIKVYGDVNISYEILESRLIVKYTVEDDTNPTKLYAYYTEEGEEEDWIRGIDLFDKIEIDGVEASISSIDNDEGNYQLSEGEHIVKYTLKDPTILGDGGIFNECLAISEAIIPNSVTSIGGAAFAECTGFTSIIIPDSVTSIGNYAFGDCTGLISVTIGNSVTSIGEYVFQRCTSLTTITIPDSVTSIGNRAFYECTGLTSVTIESTTPPTLGDTVFSSNASDRKIYVPSASVDTYKAASGWSTYASDIEAIPQE